MERLRPGDPEQIGPWQIVNRLGAGGMGIVFMGTNGTRAAAIKIVRDFLLEDPASRTRLGREVSSLKKVRSRFVAEIVGADVESTPAWIATNYVDGPSLKTLIENEGPLPESKWFELAHGLMSALQSVHTAGVIHRDVKPSNILMSATGPRLIDFGISFSSDATSLTKTGMVAGTPTWFAPEQFESNKVTSAIDNFAAGSVLYYAATGVNPWGREDTSVANTMHAILNKEADMSLLTDNQKQVVRLLHSKSPKERSTAEEIVSRLEILRSDLREGAPSGEGSKTSMGRAAKLALGLAIVSLGLGGYFGYANLASKQSEAIPTVSPTPVAPMWKVQVKGDAKATRGEGNEYTLFICDQGVIKDSLKIRELTNPPAESQPKAKLLKADDRCGAEFDTILITGSIDDLKKKRDYVLSGSTGTGFILQYEYSVTKTN